MSTSIVGSGLRGCESAMKGRLFRAFTSTQTASYTGYVGSHSAFRLCRIFSVFEGSNLISRMFFSSFFRLLFLSSTLLSIFANVWNEREADNAHEIRDFEDDEVKSHLVLSSAQPVICNSYSLFIIHYSYSLFIFIIHIHYSYSLFIIHIHKYHKLFLQ